MMNRRSLNKSLGALAGAVLAGGALTLPAGVLAADLGPQAMVEKVAGDILSAIKADKSVQGGDVNRIMALVDSRVMPHVNFERMMGTAVGPAWRQATPAQKKQVQDEFKKLLVRTYAGAFKLAGNRSLKVLPVRATGNDVLVRSELMGSSTPAKIDYRLEKAPNSALGWRVYNIAIEGIWQVNSYQQQFAPIVRAKGINGLIASLQQQNRELAGK